MGWKWAPAPSLPPTPLVSPIFTSPPGPLPLLTSVVCVTQTPEGACEQSDHVLLLLSTAHSSCFLSAQHEGLCSFKTKIRHTKRWAGAPGPHARGGLDTRIETRQKQGCSQTQPGSSPLTPHTQESGPQTSPSTTSLGKGVQDKACCGRGIQRASNARLRAGTLFRGDE